MGEQGFGGSGFGGSTVHVGRVLSDPAFEGWTGLRGFEGWLWTWGLGAALGRMWAGASACASGCGGTGQPWRTGRVSLETAPALSIAASACAAQLRLASGL